MIKISKLPIMPIKLDLVGYRVVEDQSQSSTRKLVRSDAEHTMLEELLESTKPPIPKEAQLLSHYLLYTPFRYRSMPSRGSRFAAPHDMPLFYASLDLQTALCEVAFHRMDFLRACSANLSGEVSRTSFMAKIISDHGLDLLKAPFKQYLPEISSPLSYKFSQALGKTLRNARIEAFTSQSARDQSGTNANVLHPHALLQNTYADIEKSCLGWSCYATAEVVEFRHKTNRKIPTYVFSANDFFVDGRFPKVSRDI